MKQKRKVEGGFSTLRVSIPTRLLNRFLARLYDPITQKPKYGEPSRIVTELLTDYLRRNET